MELIRCEGSSTMPLLTPYVSSKRPCKVVHAGVSICTHTTHTSRMHLQAVLTYRHADAARQHNIGSLCVITQYPHTRFRYVIQACVEIKTFLCHARIKIRTYPRAYPYPLMTYNILYFRVYRTSKCARAHTHTYYNHVKNRIEMSHDDAHMTSSECTHTFTLNVREWLKGRMYIHVYVCPLQSNEGISKCTLPKKRQNTHIRA